jgi:hypothetical protein
MVSSIKEPHSAIDSSTLAPIKTGNSLLAEA